MKFSKKLVVGFVILILVLFVIWKIMVFRQEYLQKSIGNKFANNIRLYQSQYQTLPQEDDWEILTKLSEIENYDGAFPAYSKSGIDQFKLQFIVGFDGPYLTYDSKTNNWRLESGIVIKNNK